MSFESPWWLLALLVVPAAVAAYVHLQHRREQDAALFATPALLPNVVEPPSAKLRHLPAAVTLVGLCALIFGVARPHAVVSVRRELATVVLAVDTSRSMSATDVKPTRLDAAKLAALTFADKVPDKFRLAVVAFADSARVVGPATTSRAVTKQAISQLRPGEGTALGEAIVRALQAGGAKRGGTGPPVSILMISDGAQQGGDVSPQQGAQRARAAHVPIYTVALGTPDGVVEVRHIGGFIERIRVPPSPETLQEVATRTRGKFFAVPNGEQLNQVYKDLASRLGHRQKRTEITFVFGGAGALLMLLGGGLSAALFRRVP